MKSRVDETDVFESESGVSRCSLVFEHIGGALFCVRESGVDPLQSAKVPLQSAARGRNKVVFRNCASFSEFHRDPLGSMAPAAGLTASSIQPRLLFR